MCEIARIFTKGLREEDFEEEDEEEEKEGDIGMEKLGLGGGRKRKHNSSADAIDESFDEEGEEEEGKIGGEEKEEAKGDGGGGGDGNEDTDDSSTASTDPAPNGTTAGQASPAKATKLTPFRRHLLKLSKNYVATWVEWNRIIDSFKPDDLVMGEKVGRCNGVLYVYEVDEIKDWQPGEEEPRLDLIGISIRTLEKMSSQMYFLNPFRLQHYGLPILARLPLHLMTGKQVYDYVAERLGRFRINKRDGGTSGTTRVRGRGQVVGSTHPTSTPHPPG